MTVCMLFSAVFSATRGALDTRSLSSAFARDSFGIAAHDVGTGVVSPRIVERVGVDSTRVVPDHRPSLEQLEPCWPRGVSVRSRLTFDGGRRRPLSLSQFLGDPLGLQTRLPPARLRWLTPLAQLLLVTCTGAIRKRLLRRRWLAECPSGGITCFGGYCAVGGSEKKIARQPRASEPHTPKAKSKIDYQTKFVFRTNFMENSPYL